MTAHDSSTVNAGRFQARPTVYNGIAMRSRLEGRYAAWLDANGFRWEYEPECFASELGQYLPDFLLHDVEILGSPREVYVEVKPTGQAAKDLCAEKRVEKIVWASKPDAWFVWQVPHVMPLVFGPMNLGGPILKGWDWTRATSGLVSLAPRLDPTWWDHK